MLKKQLILRVFCVVAAFFTSCFSKTAKEMLPKPISFKSEQNKENYIPNITPTIPNESLIKETITNEKISKKEEHILPKTIEKTISSIRLEKESFKVLADFLFNEKQVNYIPNEDLSKIDVSLTAPLPLSQDEFEELCLKVANDKGYTTVKIGGDESKNDALYKFVKKEAQYSEALPIVMGRSSIELEDSEKTVRFVTFLKNLSISDVDQVLKALLSPGAQVIPLQNFNGLIITDKCINIKYAMKVINELDNSGFQEVVSLIQLKETNAIDVKNFLEKFKKNDSSSIISRILSGSSLESSAEYFPSGIKIIAEERTNTLILLGTAAALERVQDFVINVIDKPLDEGAIPFDIYECQHVDCESLKRTLDEITRQTESSVGKFGGVKGGMKFFNSVKIESDKRGNRLIIYCADKQDRNIVLDTIKQLDKQVPQVFIDTMIVEVSNDLQKGLSGQIRNRSDGSPVPSVNFQTSGVIDRPVLSQAGNNMVSLLSNLVNGIGKLDQGSTLFSIGAMDDIWAILKVLSTQVNVSIISQPSITLSNRGSGTIVSEQTKRVKGETAITASGSAGIDGYRDATAKTELSFSPQINQDGLVTLTANITLNDFIGNTENTLRKTLKTKLTLANGQVMVMGGFVKTKASEATSRAPFSSIPILGHFFKSKGRSESKQYTFFFVRVNIYKPRSAPGIGPVTKMRLHSARDNVADCIETDWSKDPIQNRFFNPSKDNLYHKVVDFANARYQPTTVDLSRDPLYTSNIESKKQKLNLHEKNSAKKDASEVKVYKHTEFVSDVSKDPSIIRLTTESTKQRLSDKEEAKQQLSLKEAMLLDAFTRKENPSGEEKSLKKDVETKENLEKYLYGEQKYIAHEKYDSKKDRKEFLEMLGNGNKDSSIKNASYKEQEKESESSKSFMRFLEDDHLFVKKSDYKDHKENSSQAQQGFMDFLSTEYNKSADKSKIDLAKDKESFLTSLNQEDTESAKMDFGKTEFQQSLFEKEAKVANNNSYEKNYFSHSSIQDKEDLLKSLLDGSTTTVSSQKELDSKNMMLGFLNTEESATNRGEKW